jgi:isoquinoline 1-oxidoreductase beta subunit
MPNESRYRDAPPAAAPAGAVLDRRQLLATAAGSLLIGFALPVTPRAAEAAGTETSVSAWVRISTDESITILVGAPDMGQGVHSSLPQIIAEELMVEWSKVRSEQAPVAAVFNNPAYGSQLVAGSGSIRGYYLPLRKAGAAAREMLVAAAAQVFGVTPAECSAADGKVYLTGTARYLTYGQLAPLASTFPIPTNPTLVPDSSLRLIGKPVPRLDLPAKVDGSAQFGLDVRVPGMVYAAVMHCPKLGGTLAATPAKPAGAIAVVPLGNAVALVADNTWKAIQLLKQLSIKWTIPAATAALDSPTINSQAQSLMATGSPLSAESVGDPVAALAGAARTIDATYSLPYLAHACMEPLNCTVAIDAFGCDVWGPTQAPTMTAGTAARITGLPSARIRVHATYLGGGLGRKFEQDFIAQAVTVAKVLGKPVKLTWTREQDFTNDQYRPMTLSRVRAGVDATGNLVAWWNRIVAPSILGQRGWIPATAVDSQAVDGAIRLPYLAGSRRVEWVRHPAGVPVGFWRSVGHSINTFVVESAVDELAAASGLDPLLFRQRLLAADPRSLAVLNAAAALGDWGTPPPAGRARGIAIGWGFGSIVAQVAEISQPLAGALRVHRIACVVDCGKVVNPNTVEAQMQGGIVHGLAAALWGQMTFTKGAVTPRNFNGYRMLRLREMPDIKVQAIESGGPIGGIGEPGVPPVAPALANAYFRLTGQRVRALPFFPAASVMGDG